MTGWIIILIGCLGILSLNAALATAAEIKDNPSTPECVVLVHGMGRTALSMKRLEYYLKSHGYRVVNASYSSRRLSIQQLADGYLNDLLVDEIKDRNCKINFVTHSLGGIIVRQYLATHQFENLGRVVMLGPPNHGSEIIDRLKRNPLTRSFLGASARELGTSMDDVPNKLGAVTFECGVLAGDRSYNPLLSRLFRSPNDGKVTVEGAKVEGMKDFLALHQTHTWLMWHQKTLRQVRSFLASGQFCHARNDANTFFPFYPGCHL